MDRKHAQDWIDHIDPYRSCLDMATIFWHWKMIEKDFDPDNTVSSLGQFIDFNSDVTTVYPRGLWDSLLGRCKLNRKLQNSILIPHKPDGCVEPQDGMQTRWNNGCLELFVEGVDPKRNTFDLRRWKSIQTKALESDNMFGRYTLKWFAQYRRHMRAITPFSDYYLVRKRDSEGVDIRLFFYEEYVTTMFSDAERVGMYKDGVDDFLPFEDVVSDGEVMIHENMLFTSKLTHAFIDLDILIEECDKNSFSIPDEFRLLPQNWNIEKRGANRLTQPQELVVDRKSKFALLKLALGISVWLEHDPYVLKLLQETKLKNRKTAVSDYMLGRCELSKDEMGVVLTVLLPVEHRHGGTTDLRQELMNCIQLLWSSQGIKRFWHERGANNSIRADAVRNQIIENAGECGSNEAKYLVQLITPTNIKSTRHFTTEEWDKLRIELLQLQPQQLL